VNDVDAGRILMAVNIVMPAAGESVTSGVILKWLKQPGDFIKRDEEVVEIETDKVTLSVPSPAAGVLGAIVAKPGETVAVGQVLAAIDETATAGASAAKSPAAAPAKAAAAAPAAAPVAVPVAAPAPAATVAVAAVPALNGDHRDDARATPLARKLAEENHVDLSQIAGTGPAHKVREQDVLAFVQARGAAKSNGVSASAPAAPAATREKMTPLRQRIAQRLVQAQHTAAMLTTFNEVDMSAVMALRKTYKEDFEKKHGIGLGFMGFFVKAVVQGLQSFPLVNASIVEQGGELMIERHPTCDIAVAVSTPKGLVVPVLRRCETLSFSQIESGIKELAGKGRDGKLTLEDMSGGTFTITNGGVFGSLMSTPILNPPQSAILGMHAIKNRAVEDPSNPGQVAIRPMMYLAVSYDHRIIDGAEAVQFLVKIKQAIEDPQRLLLNV
jgi:2-oxoglutarate dehydrogenase E2 component (dihydrolipoamide succinyltransferase)